MQTGKQEERHALIRLRSEFVVLAGPWVKEAPQLVIELQVELGAVAATLIAALCTIAELGFRVRPGR